MKLEIDSIGRRVRITVSGVGTALKFYHRCNTPTYAALLAKDLAGKFARMYETRHLLSVLPDDLPG